MDAVVVVPHAYTTLYVYALSRALELCFERKAILLLSTTYPLFSTSRTTRIARLLYDPSATAGKEYDSLVQFNGMQQLPGRPALRCCVSYYGTLSPAQMAERGAEQVFDHPSDRVAVLLVKPALRGVNPLLCISLELHILEMRQLVRDRGDQQ